MSITTAYCNDTCRIPDHTSTDCYERYVLDEYEGGAGGPLMTAAEWTKATAFTFVPEDGETVCFECGWDVDDCLADPEAHEYHHEVSKRHARR